MDKFCRGCSGTLIEEEWIRRCCELCGENLYLCSECADQSEPSYFYDSFCWGKEVEKSLKEENEKKRKRSGPNVKVLKRRVLVPKITSQSIDLTNEETPKISEPVLVSTVTSEKPKILSYLYSHPPQKELTDNPPPLEPIEEVKTNVTEVDFSPIIPNHSTIMDLRDVRTKLAFRQQELRTLINRLQVELFNNEKDVKVISKFLDHLEK